MNYKKRRHKDGHRGKCDCSEVRDPENRSRKACACGGHSTKARKPRRRWQR